MERKLNDKVRSECLYLDTPGAAAFDSAVFDMIGNLGVLITLSAGAGDEDVTAILRECDTSDGTFADVTDGDLALERDGTPLRLYSGDARPSKRYVKVAVLSTPTADILYGITASAYDGRELPEK